MVTELIYWYYWFITWDLKSECLRATLRTGHSSVTTGHWGKTSSLLGERQALTPNRKTFASHLPDGFCYSLGVNEDRKQVVNVPFKFLIAFWKQNTCGERHRKNKEKPMVFQINKKDSWSQKNDAPLQQLELRRGYQHCCLPNHCGWLGWQMTTVLTVPPHCKGSSLGKAAMYSITWKGLVELVVKMHKVHKHVVSHQGLWEEYKHNSPLEHIFEESSEIIQLLNSCNPFLWETASTHPHPEVIQAAKLTGGLLLSENQTCGLSEEGIFSAAF